VLVAIRIAHFPPAGGKCAVSGSGRRRKFLPLLLLEISYFSLQVTRISTNTIIVDEYSRNEK